jgi:hypothetical protein
LEKEKRRAPVVAERRRLEKEKRRAAKASRIIDAVKNKMTTEALRSEGYKLIIPIESCASNKDFVRVARGLSIMAYYYILAVHEYLGSPKQSKNKDSYLDSLYLGFLKDKKGNQVTPAELLRGINSSDIFSLYRSNVREILDIKWLDKEFLKATMSKFIHYYYAYNRRIIDPGVRDKLIREFDKRRYQSSDVFYKYGFPKSKDVCFRKPFAYDLGFKRTSDVWRPLDFYFYSFWFRRDLEGTKDIVFKLVDTARSALP